MKLGRWIVGLALFFPSYTNAQSDLFGGQNSTNISGGSVGPSSLSPGNYTAINGVGNITNPLTVTSSTTLNGTAFIPTIASSLTVTGAGGITTSTITFSPTTSGITGTKTNDAAAGGIVGEYVPSSVLGQSVGTAGQWSDVTSIILTPGDWDVMGIAVFTRNGATLTNLDWELGISTTSGNSAAGLTEGLNRFYFTPIGVSTFGNATITIARYQVSIAATATYYLKNIMVGYTVATPQISGTLSARRMR